MQTPSDQHQSDGRPATRIATTLRTRKVRLASAPLLVVAAVLAVSYAAGYRPSGTVLQKDKPPDTPPAARQEETVPMPSDNNGSGPAPSQPKTSESVNDEGNGARTTVDVNGEAVTVPENGSYHRTTDDGTTRTNVDVDNHHQSTTSGDSAYNSSSSRVEVNVHSSSTSTE